METARSTEPVEEHVKHAPRHVVVNCTEKVIFTRSHQVAGPDRKFHTRHASSKNIQSHLWSNLYLPTPFKRSLWAHPPAWVKIIGFIPDAILPRHLVAGKAKLQLSLFSENFAHCKELVFTTNRHMLSVRIFLAKPGRRKGFESVHFLEPKAHLARKHCHAPNYLSIISASAQSDNALV